MRTYGQTIRTFVALPLIAMTFFSSGCGNPEKPKIKAPISKSISPRDLAKAIRRPRNNDIFTQAVIDGEIYASDKEAFDETLVYLRKQDKAAGTEPGVQNNITKDAILVFYKEVKKVVDQIKARNLLDDEEIEQLLESIGHRYPQAQDEGIPHEDGNIHYFWGITDETKNRLQTLEEALKAKDIGLLENFLQFMLGENSILL